MDRDRAFGAAIIAVMIVTSLFGVASAEADWSRSRLYWLLLTALFGIGALILVWMRQGKGLPSGAMLMRLGAHWLGMLGVVVITFFLVTNNQITDGQAGIMLSLSLALTTFLCGVYFDWRLIGVGIALAVVAPASALMQENLLMIILIGVLAFAAVVGGDALRRRWKSPSDADAPS